MLTLFKHRRSLIAGSLVLLVVGSAGTAALAHHSYAMFDRAKTITISGEVLTWEMTNPHSYLWVTVKPDKGADQSWGLEGGGVAVLQRAGITKSMVKPGEKISVELHPLKDGRTGGQLLNLHLADGRSLHVGGGGDGTGRAD
jgi:hypothetical protein